jgi:hypothetical protein
MKKKLIFSDFDGVYHPWPKGLVGGISGYVGVPEWERLTGKQWKEFMYMNVFADIVRKYDNFEIVLSTAWREPVQIIDHKTKTPKWIQPSLEELVSVFPDDIAQKVISFTPVHKNNTRNTGRYHEILDWLIINQRTDSDWVALDDITSYFPEYCPNLIWCDPMVALTHDSPAAKLLDDFLSDKYVIQR